MLTSYTDVKTTNNTKLLINVNDRIAWKIKNNMTKGKSLLLVIRKPLNLVPAKFTPSFVRESAIMCKK
jgi:hypothetical protein